MQVEQWLAFALAQEARAAPHPAPSALDAGGPPAAWRLGLSHLGNLPLFAAADAAFDVRLGVSLFDPAAGCFFGATACTPPVAYDMRRSKGRRGFHLDLRCALYLHTRAAQLAASGGPAAGAGAGCAALQASSSSGLLAVVELVLVERSAAGVALHEYSAGWCAVPLVTPAAHQHAPASPAKGAAAATASAGPEPGSRRRGTCWGCASAATDSPRPAPPCPLDAGCLLAQLGAGGALSVPVFTGSPRVLLLRQALPPAKWLALTPLLADGAECRLHYQFEPCPEMEAWAPLVPENWLLTEQQLVPGLRWRPPAEAAPALGPLGAAAQLPRLCGTSAVRLSGLRMHLPEGFAEVARQVAEGLCHSGAAAAAEANGSTSSGARGTRLPPLLELQQLLRLRVSAHNGRRFVGPPVVCPAAALQPVEGRRGEHELALGDDALLTWLPGDRRVVLVLELLLLPAAAGAAAPMDSSTACETVVGWAAVAPFRWHADGSEPAVAEGPCQAALRSGPGRWLRPQPVLDWRRLLERTNRPSPAAPTVSFVLAEAHGQACWPPPAAAAPLPATQLSLAPWPGAGLVSGQPRQPSLAVSEAPTLVSMQAGPQQQPQQPGKPASLLGLDSLADHKVPMHPAAAVQAWRIGALYEAPSGVAERQPPGIPAPPQLPAIRTRRTAAAAAEEAAALYAGSPTAKQARRQPFPAATAGGVAGAAAAAVDAEALLRRQVSISAELDDLLTSIEASLQLLAFEADAPAQGSFGERGLPRALHFTCRALAGGAPVVSAPLRLEPAGGGAAASAGRGQLFELAPDDAAGAGTAAAAAAAAPACLPLPLLDVAALEAAAQQLAEQGAPPGAAASLAQQHRLRAAQWLAERRLQVDVWDSASLLQVGTLSVPLRGLLRQGQPAAEVVVRVPVADPHQSVARLDADSGSPAQLSTTPLRGSFVLRLACAGRSLQVPGCGADGGAAAWPVSPLRQQAGGQGAVVTAKPALEEGGRLAQELALQEGVPEGTEPARLKEAVLVRAADKVQRLLRYQSLPASAGIAVGSSAQGAASPAGFDTSSGGQGQPDAELVGRLVERRLLGEVAAARERCRREAILARLQAELPGCVALCAAPGEALGFEREFVNSSGAPTWFQLDVRQAGGAAGAAAAADLSLVTDAAEWGGLAPAAQLAGLTCPPDGARPITAAQFQLAPQERCLLRFRLHRSLQATGSGALLWHEISIRPLGAAPGPHDSSHPAAPAAAVCRVAAHLLPEPAAHRTLRLHCPAPQGGNTTVQHSVALDQLPGADALLAAGPALCWACSAPGAASAALDRGRLVLTCQAPQAGTTSSFLLAACSSGSASPLEVWEVFLHALPLLRLQAGVGSTATASWLLPPLEHAGPGARQLALHWRCAGAGELQASVGSGPSTAATAGGAKLVLSYTPASVGRRELLLSAVAAPASGSGWAQQAALLLVALDSRGTRVSRSFAVAVPAGQAASKKVRYTSPHPQPRRFAARSLAPGALRVAPAAAAGFVLGGGEEAAIRLTLDAAACAGGLVGPPNEAGQYELLAVVESWPAGGSSGGGGSGAEAGGGRVEEVFCVLLSLAD